MFNSRSYSYTMSLSLIAGIAVCFSSGCGRPAAPAKSAAVKNSAASVPGLEANVLHGNTLTVPSSGMLLPDADYKAELKFKNPESVATHVKTGSSMTYDITITNQGHSTFPSFADSKGSGMVNLTCRTYRAGPKPQIDGGCNRSFLPRDLKAGESVTIPLIVPAPPHSGNYEIHIELVHEGLLWFEDKGSPSLIINYQVD